MAMKLLKMLSKPAAWASGWTSAVLIEDTRECNDNHQFARLCPLRDG